MFSSSQEKNQNNFQQISKRITRCFERELSSIVEAVRFRLWVLRGVTWVASAKVLGGGRYLLLMGLRGYQTLKGQS